jgi:predicted oxidoreductase
MWRIGEWNMSQQRLAWIEQCLALGVTSFDHADIYGDYSAEGLFGEALALQPGLRDKMELVSKCGIKLLAAPPGHAIQHYDTSAAHITSSVEHSLRQLQTDRLDLLLIHRPDPLMDFDEIAGAFTQLQASGKVLHFGVSNFSRHQFECLNGASARDEPGRIFAAARGAPVRRNLRRFAGRGGGADDLVAAGGRAPVPGR